MTDADNPDVIQGRLGWEDGDISEADPEELEPHPKNEEIYGDTESAADLDETFINSVREKGVLEPLVITNGKQIISGHRRWLAAKATDTDRVPVRKSEFDSELAEREALIEFNRQREKTPGQIVNEFEEMLAVEKERAKERKGERTDLNDEPVGNVSHKSDRKERARDKAAEKINTDVSGRTLEKGLEVKERAEEGDEQASEAWDDLQRGDESFHGAYERARGERDAETAEATSDDSGGKSDDLDVLTSQESDEWASPQWLVEPIDTAVDGFDLDPCSGAESSPFANEVFTEDDDGLTQPWHGAVWVNPPYSEMQEWTEKAAAEAQREGVDTVVFLCKGDSSTQWWHNGAAQASCILAVEGRLSFGDGESAAPFASHIMVFGDVPETLREELLNHGVLLRPSTKTAAEREVVADD